MDKAAKRHDDIIEHVQTYALPGNSLRIGNFGGDFGIVSVWENDERKSVLKSDRRDDTDEILLFEGVIEAFLAEADSCPLRVSQPHEASITRSGGDFYLMKNYIEGAPLNDSDINNITPEMQKQLGVKVAEFVAWMDTELPMETFFELTSGIRRKPFEFFEKFWDIDSERHPQYLLDDTCEGYENYLGLMWHLQDGYEMAKSCETERSWMIGHQDLRPDGNLIFKDNELVGVIDFGNTGLSTPESELRHLAVYRDEVLEPAIRTLEERTDYKIDKEYVSLLADLQTFVNVVFRASRSRRSTGYDLRLNYLQERYPNFELPDLMR